ncbi:MAG: hypothetical protein AAF498_01000 [Pseudomonadota bacterium]
MRWRAILGACGLHAIVYALVLTTPFKLEATELMVVPVVLVERTESTPEPAPPVIEVPEEFEERKREKDVELESEEVQTPEEEPSRLLPEEPVVTVEPVRPLAPAVRPSVADTDDDEAAEAIIIDPRYKIPPDPFAETAPSALARVTIATMCNRASLATRPDFCPSVSAEDRYFSVSARPPTGTDQSAYDPIFDIVATQSIIEGVVSGQAKHGVRSGSPELERIVDPKVGRHPEGLQNCTPVQTGLEGPSGIASGLELPLGSSDGIKCR